MTGVRSYPRVAAAALALCVLSACGKKGPPLAPLRPVPGPVTELTARRSGSEVRFTFTVPLRNADPATPLSLDRIEVYAATLAPAAPMPANPALLTSRYLAGTIPVRPLPAADAPGEPVAETPEKKDDPRPAPGDVTTFVEELNEARMQPQFVPLPVAPAKAPPTTTAAVAAAWTATTARLAESPVASRIYVFRGVSRHGRPGQPSERVTLPLAELPASPSDVTVTFTESKVTLSWSPPRLEGLWSVVAPAAAPLFNVYAPDGTGPLNAKPLDTPSFEREEVTFGTEQCFVVRTAVTRGRVTIESPATAPACVTPVDTFPPAAPTGFSAVATAGAVNLIWEANREPDLGGYIVLRGEAPGDKLQAITATPIRATRYQDTTAAPGVRYVYAVVAVDQATPPNTSPQSIRVEETAR